MIVSAAEASHIPSVAELEKRSFSRPWSAEGFKDVLGRDDVLFLVALSCRDKTDVLGYICMYMSLDEGEITNVAVLPEYKRQGIATVLLDETVKLAGERGITHIFLEVRRSNEPALGLYRSRGFKELGIRKDFYDDPKEDAYVLELELC